MPHARTALLERNIRSYYLLRVLAKRMVFPILTIFLLRNELTPQEIGTVFAAGTIIGLLFEVPSGMVSDAIGRRRSLAIATTGWAASMFLFWIGDSFWWFLTANAVYFAAGSFWTGTSEAFLFETLSELGRKGEMRTIIGKALSISQMVTGVLFVAVPLIAKYDLHLPFLLNTVVFLAGTVLVLRLTEPAHTVEEAGEVQKDKIGFRIFLSNPTLLTIGVAFGSMAAINGILEDFRQVYLDAINIDLVFFGVVYLALRFLTGGMSAALPRIEKAIGQRATLAVVPVASILTYIGLSLISSTWGLLFVVLDGAQAGLARPIEQDYLNRAITGSRRAALLSVYNLCSSLFRAACVFTAGILIGNFGIHAGFILALALSLCITVPAYLAFMRHAAELDAAEKA